MAVNNDMDLDQQIPGKSDMLLFAEDLVDYMLFRNYRNYHLKWEIIVFRNHSYNTYAPIIRRILHFIAYTLKGNHEYIFAKMKLANLLNSNNYERFAKTLAAKYFPGQPLPGFNAKYFLLYCVNLSIMATDFYIKGIRDAPDLAKQYIYLLLQKYDVLAGGWNAICKTAENYVKKLRDSLKALKELEEVTTDESSEEESLSLRNAKSNIKFQRKYACIKIKEYLTADTHCSSKEFQIGLCSLREPESSSEYKYSAFTFEKNEAINRSKSDKPRPGASNVDQELILIISDFRLKTNMLWNKIKLFDKSAS